MSYINDALIKAQREKDSRYERFGGLIAGGPRGTGRRRRRPLAIAAGAVLLVLLAVAAVMTLYGPGTPPSLEGETRVPAATESAVMPASAAPAGEGLAGGPVQTEAPPSVREAERQFREAVTAQQKGDRTGAEALYRKVLLLKPDHVQALNNLGVLYMGQKKREEAIALFSRAIVLKKDYVDPYYNLACLYAQAREIDESLRYLKIAMTLNGDVKQWAAADADLKGIAGSPAFKTLMEGQKN